MVGGYPSVGARLPRGGSLGPTRLPPQHPLHHGNPPHRTDHAIFFPTCFNRVSVDPAARRQLRTYHAQHTPAISFGFAATVCETQLSNHTARPPPTGSTEHRTVQHAAAGHVPMICDSIKYSPESLSFAFETSRIALFTRMGRRTQIIFPGVKRIFFVPAERCATVHAFVRAGTPVFGRFLTSAGMRCDSIGDPFG
jgi:hypothetical protein